MSDILKIAEQNQQRAWKVIENSNIIAIWESVGAEINLVGSLKTGLMMNHKDIDFHIYTPELDILKSFSAITQLAENPHITHIEYTNLIETNEKCIEWHAWYTDEENESWQIDMIHILKGSFYDGYMENVCKRISEVLTPEMKQSILQLKYDTPEEEKVFGILYYKAVIQDGVKNYTEFTKWRKNNPINGILHWMP